MCNPLLYIYFVLPATPETRFSGISCQYLLPDLPATVYIFSVNMTQQEMFNDPAIDYSIPKKEAAKIMNTMKKMRLGSQCVASQLKMSAVTASPPTILVIRIMSEIGTV